MLITSLLVLYWAVGYLLSSLWGWLFCLRSKLMSTSTLFVELSANDDCVISTESNAGYVNKPRRRVFGCYSPTSLIRWCAQNRWTYEEIRYVLNVHNCYYSSDRLIKSIIRRANSGAWVFGQWAGYPIAAVSDEHAAILESERVARKVA